MLGIAPPGNQPPVANDERRRRPRTRPTIGVLANDTDPDGDTLSITGVSDPGHGTAVISPSGTSIQYTPAAGYSGPDTFGYTTSDGAGGS